MLDAGIEGFQLLDGKIDNVKQKRNIDRYIYIELYILYNISIYIYIFTDSYMFGRSICYKLQMILCSMWPPNKLIPNSETFITEPAFEFPISFVAGPVPHLLMHHPLCSFKVLQKCVELLSPAAVAFIASDLWGKL